MCSAPRTTLVFCSEREGGFNIHPTTPPLEEHANVLYIPPSEHTPRAWGIFGPTQQLLPETGFYRGVHRHLVMQEPETAVSFQSIKEYAPDDIYFYGGKIHPHYGHFLLSTLSRFWPFIRHGKPACKILMHEGTSPDHWFAIPHVSFFFHALGLEKSDFVQFHRPLKIRRLIVASPSFEEEHFAHIAFAELGNAIGKTILRGERVETVTTPIYLSKAQLRQGVWRFTNEAAVTEVLSRHGVDIIFPEQLSFKDQIALFAKRRIIIGSMASGLHGSIFSWRKPALIGISHRPAVLTNYLMSDAVNFIHGQYLYPPEGVLQNGADAHFTMNCAFKNPTSLGYAILRHIESNWRFYT